MFNRVGSIILLQEEDVNNYEQLYNLTQMPLDLAMGKALVTFEENLTGKLGNNNNNNGSNLLITCYSLHTVVSALYLLSHFNPC